MKNRFYSARKKNNLTQCQVAEILNIKNSAISKWECGRTLPDGRTLQKIVKLYNVSADYLLEISDDDTPIIYDVEYQKPEILEIYDDLTPQQQENLLNYARGMAVSNSLEMKINRKKA